MDTVPDKTDELAKAFLPGRPFLEIYGTVERLFYGLDPTSLADLMQRTAPRIRELIGPIALSAAHEDLYDSDFYKRIQLGSQRSARAVVPLLMNLLQPQSVVDLGCGDGTWLSVFMECGVKNVQGMDGPWVKEQDLRIPADLFRRIDLRTFQPQGNRKYDLVFSVECAEHLEEEYAERFVFALCSLGPLICFSAAIPFQGGEGHVNEQWPDYWVQLFKTNRYHVVDCIRPLIWSNPEVESWYAQNMLLFASETALERNPALRQLRGQDNSRMLSMVHPSHYLKVIMFLLPELIRQGMY
jgi:hypothetical protein